MADKFTCGNMSCNYSTSEGNCTAELEHITLDEDGMCENAEYGD